MAFQRNLLEGPHRPGLRKDGKFGPVVEHRAQVSAGAKNQTGQELNAQEHDEKGKMNPSPL